MFLSAVSNPTNFMQPDWVTKISRDMYNSTFITKSSDKSWTDPPSLNCSS